MTLPQLRIYLREGEKLQRLKLARQARMMRAVRNCEDNDFIKFVRDLED